MWHDFFVNLWMKLFGTLEWGGLNIGFWFAMLVCVLLVVIMNVVFWSLKPKQDIQNKKDDSEGKDEHKKHIDS